MGSCPRLLRATVAGSLLFAACGVASCAVAEDPGSGEVTAKIAGRTVRDDVFPRTSVAFAHGVVGEPDIEYANIIGFRPLRLDLYSPADRSHSGPRPLVVWIHGGGWSRGDSRTSGAFANFPAVLASLAARGFVVASVNYRLSGEARFPAAIQDVKAAIGFLRRNAARYSIDPDKILLWGGSAGGQLAALAAASCGHSSFEPEPSTGRLPRGAATVAKSAAAGCVQGAVIWYGLFDLTSWDSANVPAYLGCRAVDCPATAALASPVTHASADDPPMLLIHGMADTTAPSAQSEAMAKRLRAEGARVETFYIPGADHGWMGATAAETRAASLLALQRTFDFIDATFAGRKR